MPKESDKKLSAGLLLYRYSEGGPEVFLAHPGGPFWKNRDLGAWTIPKGLVDEGEELLAAACREFEEETGLPPRGPFLPLGSVKQKAGKVVHAWAWRGDCDPAIAKSNMARLKTAAGFRTFPEIDRYGWFTADEARGKLNPAQAEFVDRLLALLDDQSRFTRTPTAG